MSKARLDFTIERNDNGSYYWCVWKNTRKAPFYKIIASGNCETREYAHMLIVSTIKNA